MKPRMNKKALKDEHNLTSDDDNNLGETYPHLAQN